MKPRKVVVTLELLTDAKTKDLKDKAVYTLDLLEGAAADIQQIQVQVVAPEK